MRGFGLLLLVGGGVGAFAALSMDVSVPSGYGLDRVNNMGLMADRQNYLLMSIAAAIIGVLMVIFGNRAAPSFVEATASASDAGMRACPFCAEPIKNEAIKCKHCSSTVEAVMVEEPKIGEFFEKPEDMSWGEYHEKFMLHYAVVRVGNGFIWKAERYDTMNDLVEAIRAASARFAEKAPQEAAFSR